jgi:hypothetical protein
MLYCTVLNNVTKIKHLMQYFIILAYVIQHTLYLANTYAIISFLCFSVIVTYIYFNLLSQENKINMMNLLIITLIYRDRLR